MGFSEGEGEVNEGDPSKMGFGEALYLSLPSFPISNHGTRPREV